MVRGAHPTWLCRKLTGQDGAVENRVNGDLALMLGVDVRHVMLVRVIEKHPNKV
jgi:hypothetical protein